MADMDEAGASAKPAVSALAASLRWLWPDRLAAAAEKSGLHFLAAPLCRACAMPVPVDLGTNTLCAACHVEHPVWGQGRAALAYDAASRPLVLSLKHGGQRDGLARIGRWMALAGADILDMADALVPVPLHYRRLASRGHNQSVWLAASVSRAAGPPLLRSALRRVRATQSQGHLSPAGRERNVAGAFRVAEAHRSRLAGRRLVLVDDVLTTGATLSACARTLLQAGAASVDVLVLARVVRDGEVPI